MTCIIIIAVHLIKINYNLQILFDSVSYPSKFYRLLSFTGNFFIFENEERNDEWCGNPGGDCSDCRGVTDGSIANLCADRIMCPVLAKSLVELNQKVEECIGDDRMYTVFVHNIKF